ncbi:FAD-binding oxidoreductase [Diaphorobacter sp. HDW4A]|uniref:NAD(P)/FAD-dependent oxidoreductase n=1 Tax=Diaphorobacter sp. HDW4A TaxID=2714924 RepID=UPI00140813EE|nr:FAD-binding oxidoreductase [Diaphorobacter sp. HDW4A]QIL81140.1 FAD-binding oxidoreductase [Diaphorobacter sp. HDW4A]
MLRSSTHLESISTAPAKATTAADVTVIGAGIVGLCTALSLQRAGLKVALFDATGAGSGASFGNAGLISTGSCIPISLPGMVWQVPRWLLDPDGPLALRPTYALKALPWVLKWLRASSTASVTRASSALHALHSPALSRYRELLGDERFDELIKQCGQLHIWSQPGQPGRADRLVAELRRQHQVPITPLDQHTLRARMPELTNRIQAGICFTEHANTVSPQALTRALLGCFVERGGELLIRSVQKIEQLNEGFRLWTNAGDVKTPKIVVAAGAHTAELVRPLGIRIPLEFERGYHVELPNPGVTVPQPFIYKDKAVAVTPMQKGLRFAGTVEIAGLRHAPQPRRVESILNTARELFPTINTEGARSWFGLRPSTPDSVPVIDAPSTHPGLYLACGHGHTGMTGAPMTGELVAQLVTGISPGLNVAEYGLSRFG